MDQSKSFSGMRSHELTASQLADGEQSAQGTLLSRCLTSENGYMKLNIPGDILPDFLVEANTAVNTGRFADATELLSDRNIQIATEKAQDNPSSANVIYLMLALILGKIGKRALSVKWYKKILEIEPNALIANELATIYQAAGLFSKVLEYRRIAAELEPENIGIWSNYAVDLMVLGRAEEGIELMRRAVQKNPTHASIHSNLLWYMHYLPCQNPQSLFEEHKRWGRIHTPPSMARTSHANDPDPNRRLKIGYICPDFRSHPTASTFEQFLDGHNRQIVEVYGYGNVAKPDKTTELLRCKFDHYRHVYGTSDEALVSLIEQDKIDILVTVGGRVANNRLLAMAYKPAPIQVDYGGIDTSGMEQIDYRLTDRLLTPPLSQRFYVEDLVYLSGGLYCFKPPDVAPPVSSLPAERNGFVTFGSFNGSIKTNPYIVSIWAEVLKANENSRFLLKVKGGKDRLFKEYYFRLFEQYGIDRKRIDVHNWKSRIEHFQLYGEVDIILDTFPVNGGMTMLEGLWMGVPAISLVGKHGFLSRTGLSILARIGLEFFAVSSPREYVAKATALTRDLLSLAKIRASMRQRMECSTLRNAWAFAAELEQAYRKMWRRWCRDQGVDVPDEEADASVRICADNNDYDTSAVTQMTPAAKEEI